MAVKEIRVSDLTGREIPPGEEVRITVSDHPAISGAVELDAAASEVEKLETKKLDIVSLAIHSGRGAPRRVVMDSAAFNGLIKSGTADEVLANARRVGSDGQQRRTRGTGGSSGPKIDYSAPDRFGQLHRGRVTEEEAAMVRADLEQANKNRAAAGQAAIDPKDPKEAKRYGF